MKLKKGMACPLCDYSGENNGVVTHKPNSEIKIEHLAISCGRCTFQWKEDIIEEVKKVFDENNIPEDARMFYCSKETYENVVADCDYPCYTWEEFLERSDGRAIKHDT